MFVQASLAHLRARWRWVRGRCPRCNRNLSAQFAHYMAAHPHCAVCKDETESDLRVWHAYQAWSAAKKPNAMKPYAALALCGILLTALQPMLQAQDSTAQKELAIAAIKKLGGKVEVDNKRPDMPVIAVNLKHTAIGDASLEHLKGLSKLEILCLKDTSVTDNGMVYLKGLTNLEVLELRRTGVTDKGLAHVNGFTKLQRLDLGGTDVTDKGLENLKRVTKLEILSIDGTKVTDAGLKHLKELSNLETLNLENTSGVSDLGLVHLKGLLKLRTLHVGGTKITDAGIHELQKSLPKVHIIR